MTPWEMALEAGNPLAAAHLSYAAYAANAGKRPDVGTSVFAFKAQCGTGYFEEALHILQADPACAQTANSFFSLLLMISLTGAVELVDEYDLFPVMEANGGQNPGVSECGLRIAAQYLSRNPEHPRARLFLHRLFPKLVARREMNLLRLAMVPVSAEDRKMMVGSIDKTFDGIPCPIVPELARFLPQAADSLANAKSLAVPFEELFPPHTSVWRVANGASRMQVEESGPAPLERPVLNRNRIAANIKALHRAAADFVSGAKDFPFDRFRGMGQGRTDPIIILSTGRVGTMAMESLLNRSSSLKPFHALNLHVETGDQNALLYKLLSANPPDFERDIRTALRYRFSEFAYCAAMGKVPVIVNHLDTVMAPILLGAFPDARLIRMHRAPEKTMLSLAYKNQFAFRQMRHLLGRFEVGTGEFLFRRDCSLTIEQECGWYMYVTDLLADIFRTDLARPGRYLDLDMEQVFGLSDAELSRLADFLDDPAVSAQTCRDVFSQRINEKSFYTFDPKVGDLDRLSAELDTTYATLSEHGTFR